MGIFNLRPARPKGWENAKMVTDLDKLVADPIAFKFKEKIHYIKAMTTETFLRVVNEMSHIDSLRNKSDINVKDVVEAYAKLFSSVCDSITLRDVYDMYPAQRAALLKQILDCVSGQAHGEEKKKTLNQ